MDKRERSEWLNRIAEGSSDDWSLILNEYSGVIDSVCRSFFRSQEDAEDAAQEVWIAVYRSRGKLAESDNPEGYIRIMARNKCIDITRKNKRSVDTEKNSGDEELDNARRFRYTDTAPDTNERDCAETLRELIDSLPGEQREYLYLKHYKDLKIREIAELKGVPEGTVKTRLNAARSKLKKSILEYEKKNKVRLHAKIALPFLPWRWFSRHAWDNAGIYVTEGQSAAQGSLVRTASGVAAALVMGGAVFGSSLTFKETIPLPYEETTAMQTTAAETAQRETVVEDIYETQVETVYETINVMFEDEREEAAEPTLPDSFHAGANLYAENIENLLEQREYYSEALNASLTFPESWVGNVCVMEYENQLAVEDKGQKFSSLDANGYRNNNLLVLGAYSERPNIVAGESEDFEMFQLKIEIGRPALIGKDKSGTEYYFSTSWNSDRAHKTELDYGKINEQIISVLESFRPKSDGYTDLLDSRLKKAIMKKESSKILLDGG